MRMWQIQFHQARRYGLLVCLFYCFVGTSCRLWAQAEDDTKAVIQHRFEKQIKPFFAEFCIHCHDEDEMEAGIRLDRLEPDFADSQLYLWQDLLKQLKSGAMPPEDEAAPPEDLRDKIIDSVQAGIDFAAAREVENNGVIRRLTVSQYKNTLQDLLGISEDLTEVLPPDGVSEAGFLNDAAVLGMSPLQLEYYFEIAEKALDICIVDAKHIPTVQKFEIALGDSINPLPFPEKLILGANNHLLDNDDFVVSELATPKSFEYVPFKMRTNYRFIEGYEGNSTVRGWREYDSIYHSVFACMRGTSGYDLGEAYELVPSGLLLRPAIPSEEIWQQSSTYGPRANFKISLRELPASGNFRVRVRASKYRDAMLLDAKPSEFEAGDPSLDPKATALVDLSGSDRVASVGDLEQGKVYLVRLIVTRRKNQDDQKNAKLAKSSKIELNVDGIQTTRTIPLAKQSKEQDEANGPMFVDFAVFRCQHSECELSVKADASVAVNSVQFVELAGDSKLATRFVAFENRNPLVGVHLGLRRDCGSTMKPVEMPLEVTGEQPSDFVFHGAINNYPRPYVETDNVNYLAGVREIGVRHEFTDGRETPRLNIHSIEFEGPYYESWPPAQHAAIFVPPENETTAGSALHARQILREFMGRAYRRPPSHAEVTDCFSVWQTARESGESFESAVKDALLVVLTSPQFLFLAEQSESPEPEPLSSFELASKLAYFLWDRGPDAELLQLASSGELRNSLAEQTDRMIDSPKFHFFVEQFVSQWLSLDKFDVVEVNAELYPKLTRDTRTQLRREPIEFMHYLWRKNFSLQKMVDSEFILANEVVASYYGLGNTTESRLEFKPIPHGRDDLGGILSQASILAGLSDGTESNPVKRGAWFARKMIAEPPDPPPPNVPDIGEIDASLPLRKRLELHRNQPGCANCHSGIDPYGVPFEEYDAAGRIERSRSKEETLSTLPDGTEVHGVRELKAYLREQAFSKFRFSFAKHLLTYAVGRQLTFREDKDLRKQFEELPTDSLGMRDLLHLIVQSDTFMMK